MVEDYLLKQIKPAKVGEIKPNWADAIFEAWLKENPAMDSRLARDAFACGVADGMQAVAADIVPRDPTGQTFREAAQKAARGFALATCRQRFVRFCRAYIEFGDVQSVRPAFLRGLMVGFYIRALKVFGDVAEAAQA